MNAGNVLPAERGPEISVIMPVFNGARFLDRAIHSVLAQSYTGWELLVVDDGSSDQTPDLIERWSGQTSRIRAFRLKANYGPSVARNYALRRSQGSTVTYLDCDDEYYPGYLERVYEYRKLADVLMFSYDAVDAGEGSLARGEVMTCNPGILRAELLWRNITSPLGVAHRRSLLDKTGGFDEFVYLLEDWLLWRRFALAGAQFLFLSYKSGRYYVRPDSLTRSRRMPVVLRTLEEAVQAGVLPRTDDPRFTQQGRGSSCSWFGDGTIGDGVAGIPRQR